MSNKRAGILVALLALTLVFGFNSVIFAATEINNWNELYKIRIEDASDPDYIGGLDGNYILAENLDKDTEGYSSHVDTANGWEPIGDGVDPFAGTFDGNGYEINGLYINRPTTNYVGLFGSAAYNATIKNVGLVDVEVTGEDNVGGLIGLHYEVTVSNSYSTGLVTGTSDVGGLIGSTSSGGSVDNSYSTATVEGSNNYVGGLVGYNADSVSNSYSTGRVDGSKDYVGGLVGRNTGSVSNSYSTGEVSGNDYVGGLIGRTSYGGSVSYSFWNTETSGLTTSDGGTGKTTSQMQREGTFINWNFPDVDTITDDDTWGMNPLKNSGYPFLAWQGHKHYAKEPSFEAGTYKISSLEELYWITQDTDRWDEDYKQTADIDATETTSWNDGKGFLPIGTDPAPFNGTYDGSGHTITGLTIDRLDERYVGLFGWLSGTVSNLELKNVNITGIFYVGGLVGMHGGVMTVENCSVTGETSSVTCEGGGSEIRCIVGGLVGGNGGKVESSYSTASVTGNADNSSYEGILAGGLVGGNLATIKNSYSTGGVKAKTDKVHVSERYGDQAYVGGLVGGNEAGTIKNSYSKGDVTRISGASEKFGGFVGANSGTIDSSYSTGSVYSSRETDWDVGGNTDKGFVGLNISSPPYTDNFFDSEASNQDSGIGATAKSTTQMQDISTFENDWDIKEVKTDKNSYPYLAWEDGTNSVWLQEQVPDQPQPQPPTATFTYIPSEPKVEKEVQFDATDSNDPDGNIVSYQWDLGDGTMTTGDEVTHTYTDDKTYTVKLTVTDDDEEELSDTASTEIEVTYEREYVQVEHSRWSMVSAPIDPADKAPTSVFSGLNNPNEIYHWDPEQEKFLTPDDGYNEVEPFLGAWVYLEEENVPRVFTIPGVYSGNVTITLEDPGWHQVGLPLEYGWSNIGVRQGDSEIKTIAVQASGPSSPHWMSRFTWDYDTANQTYTAYDASSSTGFNLKPGKAYWVKTYEPNVKLVIPYNAPPPTPTEASVQAKGIPMNSARADKLDVPQPPTPPETYSVGQFDIQVTPNPVTNNDQVTFIAAGSDVQSFKVTVFNTSGKRIHTSTRQSDHTYTWKPESNLSNGLYLYQVTARKYAGQTIVETGKLLVLQ